MHMLYWTDEIGGKVLSICSFHELNYRCEDWKLSKMSSLIRKNKRYRKLKGKIEVNQVFHLSVKKL